MDEGQVREMVEDLFRVLEMVRDHITEGENVFGEPAWIHDEEAVEAVEAIDRALMKARWVVSE